MGREVQTGNPELYSQCQESKSLNKLKLVKDAENKKDFFLTFKRKRTSKSSIQQRQNTNSRE